MKCGRILLLLCIILMLTCLVSSSPITASDLPHLTGNEPASSMQMSVLKFSAGTSVRKRSSRMTPLWRMVGSKPHGAYCQYDHECLTRICRQGHCAFQKGYES
ncbi:liver-expressed antimicrobial peptide 2-like isoform X2 [Protopterus annectens]|uniref:liver-expressed antimicrobial peptide 2-like isoform X2 n=1 Tax=Protopterus annectens TaxID=7888 RepID=UPI001CFAD2A9|nr:liver-expressed antimicrobial peptide 2-like isoform X2 [Protopterus annectens]